MGFFSKKRRNNDNELKAKCADGLYAVYKILLSKVGEQEMKNFSQSLGFRHLFYGHALNTYTYLVDTDLLEMTPTEKDFVWNLVDSLMVSEGLEWDKSNPRYSKDKGQFHVQGHHISSVLIESKNPQMWISFLKKTAEHIKEFNSSDFQTNNFDDLKYIGI